MTKMTYVNAIDNAIAALAGLESTEYERDATIEKLEALKVSLEKRNAHKSNKPTKTQVANEGLKDGILEAMADGGKYTISDLTGKVAGLEGASPQKVNALLMQLQKAQAVVREEIKRKAYFSLA